MLREGDKTGSTFWSRPDVTVLVKSAAADPVAARELAALTFKPFVKRLQLFLHKASLRHLDIDPSDTFDRLWVGGMNTALSSVDFASRDHFLNTFLLRARQQAMRLARQLRGEARSNTDLSAVTAPSPVDDPAKAADDLEQIARAIQVLDQLPADLREATTSFFFEDSSLREIGRSIGLSSSGVKKRIDRALKILRDRLGAHE